MLGMLEIKDVGPELRDAFAWSLRMKTASQKAEGRDGEKGDPDAIV